MSNNICVAISGKSGCGNSTVSQLTAEKLGFKLINYTFRSLAVELNIGFDDLCRMAEEDDKYDRLIDARQVELASKQNCVLGSRLAIWMKKDANLKIFLDAPLDVRAARIRMRENGEFKEVLDRTRLRDTNDRERYIKLYGIDNNEFDFADLIIDASIYNQFTIADMIVELVEEKISGLNA